MRLRTELKLNGNCEDSLWALLNIYLLCVDCLLSGSRGSGSNTLSMEVKTDRSCRLLALRGLLNKMPPINFTILKYIFHHFVR